ncbi:MAG: SDR family oxidoreductase [Candidatus Pacebacteria bacterium]|nr:SDR family oxidoreductase [Candidatus Paceibacterota bacterium]
MDKLLRKTALVTGAASGIGLGIAQCFALEGARVILADINLDGAVNVIENSDALKFNGAQAVKMDVAHDEDVPDVIRYVLKNYGPIDILVNNAGMAGEIGDPFPKNTIANLQKVFDTNAASAMRTSLAMWENFTSRRSGVILNIASIVAHWHGALNMKPAYNMSKAAVVSLTKTLAIDLAPYNVRVNSISPGLLYTGFWDHLARQLKIERPEQYAPDANIHDDVFLKRVGELVPLGRPQEPDDIGKAAVFLASDDAKNITGIDLPVDGGVLAR